MLARIGLGDTHHAFPIRIAHEPAVDAGEAFLLDLVGLDGNDLLAGPRAKVERDDLGRPCAKTLGHIIAGYDEILAGLVLTAHDDMAVGVACIEMIDRHPVEPGAQILLGLHHQPADHGLEIVILCAVLRRDDEAELVAVRSEAHTSELQSLMRISYAVFCLNKKTNHRSRDRQPHPPHDTQHRYATQPLNNSTTN